MKPRFQVGDFVLVTHIDGYDRQGEYTIVITEVLENEKDNFHTYRFYENNSEKIYTRILEDSHNYKFKRIEP